MTCGKELEAAIIKKFGTAKGWTGLSKHFRVVKTDKKLRQLLSSYLDEHQKTGVAPPSVAITDPAYIDHVMAGTAPQRPGIDFVKSKQKLGLQVFGFLNEWVERRADYADRLAPDAVADALQPLWVRARDNLSKKGHHMMFSVDPRTPPEFSAKGIPIDDMMAACVVEAVVVFNNRFFPDGVLGWVQALHHDKFHTHLHLLMFPKTSTGTPSFGDGRLSEGQPISLSNHSEVTVAGRTVHINYQDFLMDVYTKAVKRKVQVSRAPAFTNYEVCRNRVLETMAVLEASVASLRANEGEWGKLSIAERRDRKVRGWGAAMADPEILTKVNAQFRILAADDQHAPPLSKAELLGKETDLRELLRRHNQAAAEIANRKKKVEGLFAEWRQSDDGYRLLRRFPFASPESPSGSLRFLGFDPNRREAGSRSREEIARRVDARLARLDRLVEAQEKAYPRDPTLPLEVYEAQFTRCLEAVLTSYRLLRDVLGARRLPQLSEGHQGFQALTGKSLAEARTAVEGVVRDSAQEIAMMHRTASVRDILKMDADWKRASDPSAARRPKPAASPAVDADEPVVLKLPNVVAAVPASPNFLEQGSQLPHGVRNLDELEQEHQDLIDRLRRVQISHDYPPSRLTGPSF